MTSNMTLLINCICTRCGTTSTCFKWPGINAIMPVCVFCEIDMRDMFDVARECVRRDIDARKKEITSIDLLSLESLMLDCPYCKRKFDFMSIEGNKNMWNVHENYMLVQCPLCAEWSKIDMEE